MSNAYELLKERLPEILEIAGKAPDALKEAVYKSLVASLVLEPKLSNPQNIEATMKEAAPSAPVISNSPSGAKEIPGIALIDNDGNFRITARDLNAKTAMQKARRLIYLAIRANQRLTGEPSLSRRNVIVPLLKDWRLYDGNTRGILANDKGIQHNDDLLSLDTPGTNEADEIIRQILES